MAGRTGLWKKTEEKFRQMTDGLGRGLDEGIFETVVALNVLGVNTSQSCEGHPDRAVAAPWVDIEAAGMEKREEERDRLWKEARAGGKLNRELFEKAEETARKIKAEHYKEIKKVLDLLDRFYRDRQVRADVRLILHEFGYGIARLESQGAEFQDAVEEEERKKRMREYQQEMREFTEFLKKYSLQPTL